MSSILGITALQFPPVQVASSDPNALDDYVEYVAASANCTGALTTAAIWKITKVGNLVTLIMPPTTGNGVATTNFDYGTAIPAAYRPPTNAARPCVIIDNTAIQNTPGMIFVNAVTGVISVYKNISTVGNFTVTANAGRPYTESLSWVV